MKVYSVILSVLLSVLFSTAKADGVFIGYADGVIGSTLMGINASNATISEATFITPGQLSLLEKYQITAINAGIPVDATDLPDSLTVWVREGRGTANITSGKGVTKNGWNLIRLDSAINIKDYVEKGIWIGFSFKQASKKNIIAFADNPNKYTNCGWMGRNNTWYDKSSDKGILPIEAYVEGADLPQHNLTIVEAVATPDIVKLGEDINFMVSVRNNANVTAQKPIIKYNIGDGAITGSYTIDQDIVYRQKANITFAVPSTAITEERILTAKLSLEWADGSVDEYLADNEASVTINLLEKVFYSTMLVEEATGAWCGWCVRGIVGLRSMREKYPERFIGIGVHNGDDYVVSAYNSWMSGQIKGYPSALINRDGEVYDPNFNEMETALKALSLVSEGSISVNATLKNGKITFNSTTSFCKNISDKAYKVAYVVVEDKLPITQTNYYSGGAYGEMGGFETMGKSANVNIDDVARGVYPSAAGTKIDIPAEIVKYAEYTHSLEATMPTYANLANVFVVAILLDGTTGQVVNAAKGELTVDTDIQQVIGQKAEAVQYYNLLGQPVAAPQRGIMIVGNKKVILR